MDDGFLEGIGVGNCVGMAVGDTFMIVGTTDADTTTSVTFWTASSMVRISVNVPVETAVLIAVEIDSTVIDFAMITETISTPLVRRARRPLTSMMLVIVIELDDIFSVAATVAMNDTWKPGLASASAAVTPVICCNHI